MNKILQNFARKTLKENLLHCTEVEQTLFKIMYCRDVVNLVDSISQIVDNMLVDKLDWAMEQVEKTLQKNRKQKYNTYGVSINSNVLFHLNVLDDGSRPEIFKSDGIKAT